MANCIDELSQLQHCQDGCYRQCSVSSETPLWNQWYAELLGKNSVCLSGCGINSGSGGLRPNKADRKRVTPRDRLGYFRFARRSFDPPKTERRVWPTLA
jgi:hypothetical protein